MRSFVLSAVALSLAAGTAFAAADGVFSDATVNGITKALEADGCQLGEIHSGSGYYTVDNATCADGTYTVTVDTDFKITDKKKKD